LSARLIPVDGSRGESGGQILRTALALSAATGQGFEMTRIRAGRVRTGLRPQHLAAIHAAAMTCGAKVHGAFDGSPDLRFEPGAVTHGDFRFDLEGPGAAALILQTVVPVLATAASPSRVAITGGTHVPASPSFEYLARHWSAVVERLGLACRFELERAGFYPPGGGEMSARIEPWKRPGRLVLRERGAFVAIRGVSGEGRSRTAIAESQSRAAQARFWEARRLEAEWQVASVPSASPGAFLFLEAVFEKGRGAFCYLAERGVRGERLGDRAARRVLRFLDEEEGAVDGPLADQLAVPFALARGGGEVSTCEVTKHLHSVCDTLKLFGFGARVFGRTGGPGGLEVEAS
jgi:RNA 3'-terminal phosphate cyclase (ATP)